MWRVSLNSINENHSQSVVDYFIEDNHSKAAQRSPPTSPVSQSRPKEDSNPGHGLQHREAGKNPRDRRPKTGHPGFIAKHSCHMGHACQLPIVGLVKLPRGRHCRCPVPCVSPAPSPVPRRSRGRPSSAVFWPHSPAAGLRAQPHSRPPATPQPGGSSCSRLGWRRSSCGWSPGPR